MRRLLFIGLFVIVFGLLSSQVSAHVLIRDESKSASAVLHVVPDDDPVASKTSQLVFDVKLENSDEKISSAVLTIINPADQKPAEVPLIIKNSILSAAYIFPGQGLYRLKLEVTAGSKTYVYDYAQRVSRGATVSATEKRSYAWAEIGLISSICLLFLLLFLAVAHRKKIGLRSKM